MGHTPTTGQHTIGTLRHPTPGYGHVARAEHIRPGVALVSEGVSLGHHHHIIDHHQLVTSVVGALASQVWSTSMASVSTQGGNAPHSDKGTEGWQLALTILEGGQPTTHVTIFRV